MNRRKQHFCFFVYTITKVEVYHIQIDKIEFVINDVMNVADFKRKFKREFDLVV